MVYRLFCVVLLCKTVSGGHPRNLAWNGGPLHLNCERGVESWTHSGRYVRDNVIAIKAVPFKDEIYVITPRIKRGVLATVWQLVRSDRGVELQPYPELRHHEQYDCSAVQNAVDSYLDHLGILWLLDTGVVDTLEAPRCTCGPRVWALSLVRSRLTRSLDLSAVTEPDSVLQNVVVEYGLNGKPFVYVSDASRGAILVHETASGAQWSVLACAAASSLQLALVQRTLAHSLLIIRDQHPGLLEMDTATLRRKHSLTPPLRVYGERSPPVVVLGADLQHVYLRHSGCSDVLSWDTRLPYNSSRLLPLHSAGPRLTTTAVAADPLKHVLLVLDSNYADTVHTDQPTYHKITFIDKL